MAQYLTGESRTITYQGNLTGTAYTDTQCVDGNVLTLEGNFCEFWINAFFCSFYGRLSWKSNYEGANCAIADVSPDTVTRAIEVEASWFGVQQDYTLDATDYNGLGLYADDVDGSYSITFEVEEWIDEDVPPSPLVDSDLFPDYSSLDEGGGPVDDGMTSRRCFFFERAKIGEDLVASITVAGITATFTIPIDAMNQFDVLLDGDGIVDANYIIELMVKNSNQAAGTGTTAATCNALGVDLGVAYTKTNGSQTVTAATGCSATSAGGGYATGDMYLSPDNKYNVATKAFCFNDTYPNTLVANWRHKKLVDTTINMGDSATVDQKYHVCGASLNGSSETQDIADEQGLTRFWLREDSLIANGEDTTDWRLQIRGKKWPALEVEQAENHVLDDGASATDWSGGSNTTYSNTGTAHRAVVSGGVGSIIWDATKNLEGYRYLEIDAKAVGAGKPFILHLTHTDGEDKQYTGETVGAGSFATVRFDLCLPDDLTDDDDSVDDDCYTQESRFPLETGSSSVPQKSDALWGFNEFDTLTIEGLEDGETYEFKNIKLIRRTFAEVSFIPAFEDWKAGWTSNSVKSQFWTNSDGRICDDALQQKQASSYSWTTILGIEALIERRLGWDVTMLTTFPDGYHTNDLEALHLWGGGVLWNGGSSFTPGCDVEAHDSEPLTVYGQALWDEVRGYPEIGDKFNGSSYGGALKLGVAKQLRGQAWGLVSSSVTEEATSGVMVTLKTDPGGASAGSGGSDAQGFYQTGLPYGKNDDHLVHAGTVDSPVFEVYNRMRHRRCLLVVNEATGITYVATRDLAHFAAYINADGYVVTEWSDNGLVWDEVTQEFTAEYVHYWATTRGGVTLWLGYSDGVKVYKRSSFDGRTFSEEEEIADGTRVIGVALDDGGHFEYYFDSGDIKGKQYDANDNLIGSEFTAVSGVDDAPFDAFASSPGGGGFRVVIKCIISSANTTKTSPDGKTFS